MKKTVLAIAVGAALATAGVAQAEVTIFGKAHLSFDMINAKDPDTTIAAASRPKNSSDMYVSSNSSSLGFKEEEDLGDGMKAGLFFDTGLTADAGSTAKIFDRQTYAYLSGGFGNVSIGKLESPSKMLGRKVDFFGDQVGDSRNLTAQNGGGTNNAPTGTTSYGMDSRPAGVIQYTSPAMGPVSGQLMYKPNEAGATTTDGNTQLVLAVNYSEGPLFVGFAYENVGAGLNGGTYATTDTTKDQTNIRIGASFAMGDATVAGLFQSASNIAGVDSLDQTIYGIGGAFKLGAGLIKAQYYMASEYECTGCGSTKTGGSLLAIGYDHNMSKKTKVYAAYAMTSNEKYGTWSAVAGGHGSEQKTNPDMNATSEETENSSGLSFGIIHSI